jgi:ABC-2 type transport system permease protein
MLLRIRNLIIKELIQFARDRLLTLFILLAPTLQLILMAQAVERGIQEQPLVLMDLDHSRLSRQLAVELDNSEDLDVQFRVDRIEDLRRLLDEGSARLAVVIPAGFGQGLLRASSPQLVQVIVDGTNTIAGSVCLSAASSAVTRFAADLAASLGLIVPEFIDFRTSVRFNPTLDLRYFTIPAQLGFIIYQVSLAVASLGLARERELGTLEQLMVTPLRRLEIALGKGIPAIGIGGLNFLVMWFIGRVVFHVPMRGSFLFLASLTLLFVTAVVGWGLFLSAISRTQQQAILFVFIQAMVDIAFSGFLVPVARMPPLLQAISRLVPLRYYLEILRSVSLKGAGLEELLSQTVALVLLSLIVWLIALRSVARRVG